MFHCNGRVQYDIPVQRIRRFQFPEKSLNGGRPCQRLSIDLLEFVECCCCLLLLLRAAECCCDVAELVQNVLRVPDGGGEVSEVLVQRVVLHKRKRKKYTS